MVAALWLRFYSFNHPGMFHPQHVEAAVLLKKEEGFYSRFFEATSIFGTDVFVLNLLKLQ